MQYTEIVAEDGTMMLDQVVTGHRTDCLCDSCVKNSEV